MKKISKCFIIVFAMIIPLLLGGCRNWDLAASLGSHVVRDFEEHEKNLHFLGDFCYAFYNSEQQENENVVFVRIDPIPSEQILIVDYWDGDKCYRSDSIEYGDDIAICLDSLYEAFSYCEYGGFEAIVIHRNRISFHRSGAYSLVYTMDGAKPRFVYSPKEDFQRYYVKKASHNWYHILGAD